MKFCAKALIVMACVLYLASLVGCATPPKKEEASQEDVIIQNLTGENTVLRREIDRLTGENEILRKKALQLEAEIQIRSRAKEAAEEIK